ncbi:MAG: hypothetical protein H7Y16_09555 [Candidatus Parcubacteria bacterium]|nr:hypothetical protein [Burkholderiales bacterium]
MTEGETTTDVETFLAPWPGVLAEMRDFLDLWFLAMGRKRQAKAVRIFISRTLVPEAKLQPHVREFRASIARIPNCRVELKGTDQAAHKIEIEYGR